MAGSQGNEPWTVRRVLEWTRGDLEKAGDDHARLSAEWLLSAVTGKSRVELYLAYDEPLDPTELKAMHDAILRRRAGEPLQYISGETAFRHIVLRCAPGVLIPRPETELLVEEVLAAIDGASSAMDPAALRDYEEARARWEGETHAREKRRLMNELAVDDLQRAAMDGEMDEEEFAARKAKMAEEAASADDDVTAAPRRPIPVLEIGCGTGCIALSVAKERDLAQVTATDISPEAVALATRNRDVLGLTDAVDIVQCDLDGGVDPTLRGTFQVLVSNPPYIPTAVVDELPGEVHDFEPRLALDGGADGLDVYRRILEAGKRQLTPGGTLAVELFEGHLDEAAHLAREDGWERVKVLEDLTGRPRILTAIRP